MKKAIPILIVLCAVVLGCTTAPQTTTVESWVHEIEASEFTRMTTTDGKPYLLYKYVDSRFNATDWFDCWGEDWANQSGGWSRWDSVYDPNLGLFLYQPTYYDGHMTMYAYTASAEINVGVKLRYYRLRAD